MGLLGNPLSDSARLACWQASRHFHECLSWTKLSLRRSSTFLSPRLSCSPPPPPNLCRVTRHLLVVHGLEDVVLPGTVVVAGARLDEHHVLLHDLPIGTFELHGEGGGPVGGAAPAVQADAAELGPVGLGGGAAGDFKLHGL